VGLPVVIETAKAPHRMSKSRRSRIRLLAAERAELEPRVAARTASQQDAYRARIILHVATGQTDGAIARGQGSRRTHRLLWRHRLPTPGLACRPWHARSPLRSIQPVLVQTHGSIKDLAVHVAAHPELGLGSPSKSTIGVILKRHQIPLDRL
jgi:hypothetical protein